MRLIALDLDGTLLNDEKELTEENRKALAECMERGIYIVPTTGRTLEGIPAEIKNIPGIRYAITVNGGRIMDKDQNITIDSRLLTRELRQELEKIFVKNQAFRSMFITVLSFGFKYGIPLEADLVFDVRFLPNPFYVEQLRPQTGLDAGVRDYVFGYPQAQEFMERLTSMIDFLLPQFVEEGKSALVIAIGCTGGHHRSVAVTHALAEHIRSLGYAAGENHRDMTRG